MSGKRPNDFQKADLSDRVGRENGRRRARVHPFAGLAVRRCILRLGPMSEADPESLAGAVGPTRTRDLTRPLRR